MKGHFTIARGAKTHVDVVVCAVEQGGITGWGEGTPIYYHGETAASCLAQLEGYDGPLTRDAVNAALPPGAARNALDCALWDVEVKRTGQPLWQLIGAKTAPGPLPTAITISIDSIDAMASAARDAVAAGYQLLKLKLAGDGQDEARCAAVRSAAPDAELIVDANESWDGGRLIANAKALKAIGIAMIEQPVAPGNETQISAAGAAPVIWCADESAQDWASFANRSDYYQAVNIKLDKAGGLSAALHLAREAQARGMQIMLGCMLSTSMGIRPALALAAALDPPARWIDLDGAALLARDRPGGLVYAHGCVGEG